MPYFKLDEENASVSMPVIAGLAVGVAFVIAFALIMPNSPVATMVLTSTDDDNNKFFSLPHDSMIIENPEFEDDVDGCCGEIVSFPPPYESGMENDNDNKFGVFVPDTSGNELKGGVFVFDDGLKEQR